MSDGEILAALDLPDPDTLGRGDDFARFMARAVPSYLRNRALRRLWTSNPVLANLDRLVDYDEDYNVAAAAGGIVRSAYQVGRGMTAHIEAVAAHAARRAAADAAGPEVPAATADDPDAIATLDREAAGMPDATVPEASSEPDPGQDPDLGLDATESTSPPLPALPDAEPAGAAVLAPPRRMRFMAIAGATAPPQEPT